MDKLPSEMWAMVTTSQGGFEKLQYRRVPLPQIQENEVLIQVSAAGINNTEINTRLGWYSDKVNKGTQQLQEKEEEEDKPDGGWGKPTPFPLIQGTDCCGQVIACGSGKLAHLLGQRILVRPCMASQCQNNYTPWFGSDIDGSFAQFTAVPATEVFPVHSDWSDIELASIPCAYGTAENLLTLAELKKDESILITGASGGVGSAAVQLAKIRGAQIYGLCGHTKMDDLKKLGATPLNRSIPLDQQIKSIQMDTVLDMVGGENFPQLFETIKRGGRYVSSGAIAGPMVSLDLRKLYLKDITMKGGTAWQPGVFENLISYIEEGKIHPLIWKSMPMDKMVEAQKEFLQKKHFGKMVLLPNPL
ncbi:zinc-binding dehydrogenase [Oceanispirochaeta crateris]|nr:zinc-binding dehydrogenase [Oceanispirochaeta crateris]